MASLVYLHAREVAPVAETAWALASERPGFATEESLWCIQKEWKNEKINTLLAPMQQLMQEEKDAFTMENMALPPEPRDETFYHQ